MKTTFHLVITCIPIFWTSKKSFGFIYLNMVDALSYRAYTHELLSFPATKSVMLNNVNIQTHHVPCPWMEEFTRSRWHWFLEWGITVIKENLWRRRACIQTARRVEQPCYTPSRVDWDLRPILQTTLYVRIKLPRYGSIHLVWGEKQ